MDGLYQPTSYILERLKERQQERREVQQTRRWVDADKVRSRVQVLGWGSCIEQNPRRVRRCTDTLPKGTILIHRQCYPNGLQCDAVCKMLLAGAYGDAVVRGEASTCWIMIGTVLRPQSEPSCKSARRPKERDPERSERDAHCPAGSYSCFTEDGLCVCSVGSVPGAVRQRQCSRNRR